ncbi:MAG: alpha/beta fold hydrolase [Holdemania filiformis]
MILENPLKGTRAKRPVIIFLHGFGRKRTGELEAFQKAFENDYDILMPELFDPEDPKDSNGILWANRALHVVEKELLKQRKVILGGFSMGGVIASWIATLLPVES